MRDRLAGPRSGLTQDAGQDFIELAHVLAHELGEIAALFDGYIYYLDDAAPHDAVASLRRTTERLRHVYGSVLELADIAASEPCRAACDPGEVVARAAASRTGIDVRIPPLPAVMADPRQLEQLFAHLLRSATIRAPAGRPVVVTGSHDGAEVRLDVGVDPERGDPAAGARSLVGRGVDLAVSSQIAERNGGQLWVTSSDRSGTTISLTLPAADR